MLKNHSFDSAGKVCWDYQTETYLQQWWWESEFLFSKFDIFIIVVAIGVVAIVDVIVNDCGIVCGGIPTDLEEENNFTLVGRVWVVVGIAAVLLLLAMSSLVAS